jgi:hypothetical protein
MKIYDTWYHEVDGWLVHYCEMCNAEVMARNERELHEQLEKHKLFVSCRGC